MKDFIIIFVSVYVLLNISTKFVRNTRFNFIHIVILWGKIFFISSLFIIPIFILFNFHIGFEKLISSCIRFWIALMFTSLLSIPTAIILNKFDPLIKKNKLTK